MNPLLDFDSIVTIDAEFATNNVQYIGWSKNCSAPDKPNQYETEEYRQIDWTKNEIEQGKCAYQRNCSNPTHGPRIISNIKSDAPRVHYLLRDILSQNPGSCDKLGESARNWKGIYDLSYDGETLLFSTSPSGCKRSLHLFKCNIDGSNLVQLTDGALADFDPAFLPNDRIVFVSLRSWSASRCQPGFGFMGEFQPDGRTSTRGIERIQPGGQLWTMDADGSNMYQISFHETNELHPVVDNDGKIVYTRWDYIDRDFCAGHHIWVCGPDGTDPRAMGGNYALPHYRSQRVNTRRTRPETHGHIRPIPGQNGRYIAVAGQHHGFMPGTPFLLNTNLEDDNNMSQTKRILGLCFDTERTGDPVCPPCGKFKLSVVYKRYVTPWPLNENFYLISRRIRIAPREERVDVILLDRFGNEILIDAGGGMGPRPLRPREKQTVIPDKTYSGPRDTVKNRPKATISLTNVYNSDFEWPTGTKIEALRIIQVVPKPWSCPLGNNMALGWSVGAVARMVLGTVPVEEDGSAYFLAPINCEIYFQALDSLGMAVQSMRSGTYVHQGENLSCLGCHENKWQTSPPVSPSAFTRPPSPITQEPEGSLPLNFHRLVKPVFENTCLPCHEKEGKGLMSFEYNTDFETPGELRKWAFYYDAASTSASTGQGMRSEAGNFGAQASKLGKALLKTHMDRITPEEFRRVVVWLDANSMNMAACHDFEAQMDGEVVWPLLVSNTPDNPQALDTGGDGSAFRHRAQLLKAGRTEKMSIHYHAGILTISGLNGKAAGLKTYGLDGRLIDQGRLKASQRTYSLKGALGKQAPSVLVVVVESQGQMRRSVITSLKR